jgi:hypothetical protein
MNDLRMAVRTLSKSPGLAATAALTFALGIGANTAIFSVIYAVLLRATPYANADRLVRIHERGALGPGMSVSPLNFQDWKLGVKSFERLSLFRSDEYTIGYMDPPIRALGAQVSAELFYAGSLRPTGTRLHASRGQAGRDSYRGDRVRFLAAALRWRSEHRRPSVEFGREAVHYRWRYDSVLRLPGAHAILDSRGAFVRRLEQAHALQPFHGSSGRNETGRHHGAGAIRIGSHCKPTGA